MANLFWAAAFWSLTPTPLVAGASHFDSEACAQIVRRGEPGGSTYELTTLRILGSSMAAFIHLACKYGNISQPCWSSQNSLLSVCQVRCVSLQNVIWQPGEHTNKHNSVYYFTGFETVPIPKNGGKVVGCGGSCNAVPWQSGLKLIGDCSCHWWLLVLSWLLIPWTIARNFYRWWVVSEILEISTPAQCLTCCWGVDITKPLGLSQRWPKSHRHLCWWTDNAQEAYWLDLLAMVDMHG